MGSTCASSQAELLYATQHRRDPNSRPETMTQLIWVYRHAMKAQKQDQHGKSRVNGIRLIGACRVAQGSPPLTTVKNILTSFAERKNSQRLREHRLSTVNLPP